MHEFEEVENAALIALRSITNISIRTIEAYAGQLEGTELSKITVRFPCVYVVADGMRVDRKNGIDECTITLLLLCGDKNFRSNAAAARGGGNNPGVYAMLESVREALHRKKMLAGWSPAYLTSEETKIYDISNSMCLYSAMYEIQAQRKL